ncbi:MAG: 50S ribosomal protein L9 [Janthinobacterium lividum]
MEVILIKPLKKVGKIGNLVKVKNGYARNWLIPQGFALRATDKNKATIENQKQELEESNSKAQSEAEVRASIVEGKDLIFVRQSAADGRLFGSVSSKEIVKEILTNFHQNIPYSCVELEAPLKFIGTFPVIINLHHDVTCNITVAIARSESEGQEALRIYKITQAPEITEND